MLLFVSLICVGSGGRAQIGPEDDLQRRVLEAGDGADLSIGPGRFEATIVVEGKDITLRGAGRDQTILTTIGSDAVVIVRDGGSATLRGLSIAADQPQQLAAYALNGALDLDRVTARGGGVYVEAGALRAAQLRIEAPYRSAVTALDGADIALEDVRIEDAAEDGIAAQNAGRIELLHSRISAQRSAVWARAPGQVEIEGNTLRALSPDGPVVFVDDVGDSALDMRGNIIAGGRQSLDVRGLAGPARIADNTLFGGAVGGAAIGGDADAAPEVSGNAVIVAGDDRSWGLYLDGSVDADLRDNTVVGPGAGLVFSGDTGADMQGNVVISEQSRALAFDGAPARASRLGDDILVPPPGAQSGVQRATDAESIARVTNADARAAMRAAAAPLLEATDTEVALPPGDLPERLAALDKAAMDLRRRADATARLTVRARDAAGESAPAAFTVHDETGAQITRGAPGETVTLAPGRYRVASPATQRIRFVTLESGTTRSVTLAARRAVWTDDASDTRTLLRFKPRAEIARMLDLLYRPDTVRDVPRPALATEAHAAALQAARDWRDARGASLRTTAEAAGQTRNWHRIDSLAEAILRAHGTSEDIPRPSEDMTMAAYMEARLGRLRDGAVAAAAEAGETAALRAKTAGELARYGIGGHEETMLSALRDAIARREDPPFMRSALRHLRRFPDPEVRAAFREIMSVGQDAAACRSEARATVDDASETRSYSEILDDLGCAPFDYISMVRKHAIPYLAAHGDRSDWQRIAETEDLLEAEETVPFLATPGSVIDRWTKSLTRMLATPSVFEMCEAIEAVRPGDRKRLHDLMRESYMAALEADTGLGPFQRPMVADMMLMPCRPSELAAGWYIRHLARDDPGLLGQRWRVGGTNWDISPDSLWPHDFIMDERFDWFVEPDLAARSLSEMFERSDGEWYLLEEVLAQIDAVPHDRVGSLLDAYRGESALRDALIDLMTAYHATTTRQPMGYGMRPADGIQRRPYLLREMQQDDYGGALSGILEVRPRIDPEARTVQIGVRVDQRAHLFRNAAGLAVTISGMDKPEAYDVHRYVVDRGRALIGSVELMGAGGDVKRLAHTGVDDAGFHLFEAPVERVDFAGRHVAVDLAFGREPQFVFDLFSRDAARLWRQARTTPQLARTPQRVDPAAQPGATHWTEAAAVYADIRDSGDKLDDRIARAQAYLGAGLPDGDARDFATLRDKSDPALRAGVAGQVLFAKNHFARAAWMFAEQAKQAPEGSPARATALNNLGAMLAEVHAQAPRTHHDALLTTALAATRRAVDLAPDKASIQNTHGKVAARAAANLREAGRAPDQARRLQKAAVAAAERAVEQASDVPLYWANLARARRTAGDFAGAGEALREAHRLRPNGLAYRTIGADFLDHAAIRQAWDEAAAEYCDIDYACLEVCPGSIVGRLKVINCEIAQQKAGRLCHAGEPFPDEYDCLAEIPSYGLLIPGLNAGGSFVTPWGATFHFIVDGQGRVRFSGSFGVARGRIGAYSEISGVYDPKDGLMISNAGVGANAKFLVRPNSTPGYSQRGSSRTRIENAPSQPTAAQLADEHGHTPMEIRAGAEYDAKKGIGPTADIKTIGLAPISN